MAYVKPEAIVIEAELTTGVWTDISADVDWSKRVNAKGGMGGSRVNDRMAATGTMTFVLIDTTGKYLPGSAAALSGWQRGTHLRQRITFDGVPRTKWMGRIEGFDIDAGTTLTAVIVGVDAVDWMDDAARFPLVAPAIETLKRADEGLTTILAGMARPPAATDFAQGINVFLTLFDTVTGDTIAFSEMYKLVMSEMGMLYLRRDKTYGETLVFENVQSRHGLRALKVLPKAKVDSGFLLNEDGSYLLNEDGTRLLLDQTEDAALVNCALDAKVRYGKRMVNRITNKAHPKRVDTEPVVLFSLDSPIPIGPGQTITFSGNGYSDPYSGSKVNAIPDQMIDPISSTYIQPNGDVDRCYSVACVSADGQRILTIAGRYGFPDYVYFSESGGAAWSQVRSSQSWWPGAMTPDGERIIVGMYPGRLYLSIDHAGTWQELRPAGDINVQWTTADISDDGKYIIVGANDTHLIYYSTDYGSNWTPVIPGGVSGRLWYLARVSGDGSTFLVSNSSRYVYVSLDHGASWVDRTPPGFTGTCYNGTISKNGQKLFLPCTPGRIHTSTDQGLTWIERRPEGDANKYWYGGAADPTGSILLVGEDDVSGSVYISRDGGDNWLDITPPLAAYHYFRALAIDDSGFVIIVGEFFSGRLFITTDGGSNWESYTDYAMFKNSDGSGTDLTFYLTVDVIYGTEAPSYTLVNTSSYFAWITMLNARGFGVYAYNPVKISQESAQSVEDHGYQQETIDQLYQQDPSAGAVEAAKVLELEKFPRSALESMRFSANASGSLMMAFLEAGVGDLVHLQSDILAIDGWYYIQGEAWEISPGGVIDFTWTVAQAWSLLAGLSLIGIECAAASEDALAFGVLAHLLNLSTRTLTVWVYLNDAPGANDAVLAGAFSDGGGFYLAARLSGSDVVLTLFTNLFAGANGRWDATGIPLTTGAWHLIEVCHAPLDPDADPVFYVDGSSASATETETPSGAAGTESGEWMLGNIRTTLHDYDRPLGGVLRDVRVYDRALSAAERALLVSEGAGGASVTDGLIWQGPCVRTSELARYEDLALTSEDKMLDNVYGFVGTAHGAPCARLIL